ncbi:hypothetical protein [Kribbella sp. VKM Ac-2569]|uniref:hypothetical protein n=1 Tax=Kribbella sp. VKM Ac-2569 TaxID=2512220 RepID=UPI00102C67DD|nr:hypothetical protein [Kribbella sp. VKM Ac-2569]
MNRDRWSPETPEQCAGTPCASHPERQDGIDNQAVRRIAHPANRLGQNLQRGSFRLAGAAAHSAPNGRQFEEEDGPFLLIRSLQAVDADSRTLAEVFEDRREVRETRHT